MWSPCFVFRRDLILWVRIKARVTPSRRRPEEGTSSGQAKGRTRWCRKRRGRAWRPEGLCVWETDAGVGQRVACEGGAGKRQPYVSYQAGCLRHVNKCRAVWTERCGETILGFLSGESEMLKFVFTLFFSRLPPSPRTPLRFQPLFLSLGV